MDKGKSDGEKVAVCVSGFLAASLLCKPETTLQLTRNPTLIRNRNLVPGNVPLNRYGTFPYCSRIYLVGEE
ncbi:hypothetical protein LguiB_006791 [Lonicera macranthoides]